MPRYGKCNQLDSFKYLNRELMMKNFETTLTRSDPLRTLQKLLNERYQDALAVFWAGSVSNDQGNGASDLDLVIVYEQVPNAWREAFIYEGWPIDTFVHDKDTLRYFFEDSKNGSGISGLLHMVLYGREIIPASTFSENIKTLAKQFLQVGPSIWNKDHIDKERFLITDTLEDVLFPKSRAEQIASVSWLYEALSQFYFRAQNKWCASGKSIARYLEQDNPELAQEFSDSFEKVFQTGEGADLKNLTQKILQPFGGFLWDNYKSAAPKDARISEAIALGQPEEGYQVYLDESNNENVGDIILKGLKSYNESKIGSYSRKSFLLFIRSQAGQVIAGLSGDILGNLCGIHLMWVDDLHRKKGLGAKIIRNLEQYALSKGCNFIQLDTAEFQAKEFYEKLGYATVAVLDQGFMGYKQYIMRKVL
jgi:GNAT superfamily N-acetyltransferase